MIQRWSNVSGPMQTILELTGDVLERYQAGPEALEINADVTNELLRQVSSPLMALMRTNSVSGAFIVFDGPGTQDKKPAFICGTPTPAPPPQRQLRPAGGPGALPDHQISQHPPWTPCGSLPSV